MREACATEIAKYGLVVDVLHGLVVLRARPLPLFFGVALAALRRADITGRRCGRRGWGALLARVPNPGAAREQCDEERAGAPPREPSRPAWRRRGRGGRPNLVRRRPRLGNGRAFVFATRLFIAAGFAQSGPRLAMILYRHRAVVTPEAFYPARDPGAFAIPRTVTVSSAAIAPPSPSPESGGLGMLRLAGPPLQPGRNRHTLQCTRGASCSNSAPLNEPLP